jgi:dihydrofolate reductase
MRKLRILAHVSLDNILDEGEDSPHGAWTAPYRHPAGAAAVAEAQGHNIDLLLGRRTYDLWSTYWPNQKGGHFAATLNAATKHIATHRPESLGWGPVKPLGPDLIAGIRTLKSQPGPDLVVWGSTTLTPVLLSEGLADEIVLIIYPVLLGSGKRFFPTNAAPREFAHVSSKASPTGALINTYRHVGPLTPKS